VVYRSYYSANSSARVVCRSYYSANSSAGVASASTTYDAAGTNAWNGSRLALIKLKR